MQRCPLCQSTSNSWFFGYERKEFGQLFQRDYYLCSHCELVFLNPNQRLQPDQEKSRYTTHQNNVLDPGYRQFLRQLWDPLKRQIQPGACGLDYGCGPTKALAGLAAGEPYTIESYDPYFCNNKEALLKLYDFVFCSEVVEHLYHPGETLKQIFSLCAPGGVVGVMTSMLMDLERFPRWHYHHDATHVVFYQPTTMRWIAEHFQCSLSLESEKVALFHV